MTSRRGAAVVATVLALAANAGAQGTGQGTAGVEQAKSLFNAGAEAYAAGRYPAAIQAFEEAYRLAPHAAILFSMGQAERKEYFVGKSPEMLRRAIKHYREYVAQTPSGGRRADAADGLAELEPIASRLDAQGTGGSTTAQELSRTRLMVTSQTPGATIALDGAAPQEAPLIDEVKPGKHVVRVDAPGFVGEQREVVAVEGTLVPLDLGLREQPARVTLDAPGGADVVVDGRPAGRTPLPQPLELGSGSHVLTLLKTGHRPSSVALSIERATARTVTVRLETTGQRTIAWTLLGVGAAGIVAGGVFTGVALGQQSRARGVEAAQANGNITAADLAAHNGAIESRDRWRTASIAAFGVGTGVLAAGAVLYFFDAPGLAPPPADAPATRPAPGVTKRIELSAAPLCGPDGCGALVRGRF